MPFALDDAVAASFRNLWGLLLIPLSFEAADCPRPEQNCGKRYYRQALRHGSHFVKTRIACTGTVEEYSYESSGLEGPSGRRPPGHMRPGRGGRPGVRWLCALPLFLWALFSGCQWGRSSRPSRQVQVRERSSRSGTLPRRTSRTRRSVAGRAPSASASESESARRGHRH